MKKYITPALLGFLLLALTVFIPITAKAQVSDIGSGGSTSIIGLPSGRSYFQDAKARPKMVPTTTQLVVLTCCKRTRRRF